MQLNFKIENILNQFIKQQQQNKMPTLINTNGLESTTLNNNTITTTTSPIIVNMEVDLITSSKSIKLEIDNANKMIEDNIVINSNLNDNTNSNAPEILSSSSPSSPLTINSQDNQSQVVTSLTQPTQPVNEDDSEIPAFAKILLNISSNGIQVPNLSESSPAILTGKLKDSSNGLVPFDLMSSEGGANDDNDNYKKKRQRTSPEQLAILEQIFETDKMPSQQIRVRLANQLGMSSRRVQIWFQNKRAKVKRGGPYGGKDDDYLDEEDEDLDDNNLTIDDTTNLSALNTSSDNIVPSISPILSSVNITSMVLNNLSNSNNNSPSTNSSNSSSSTSPIIPSFNLNQSSSNIKLNSASSSIVPSPLKKLKRPPSPTSLSSSSPNLNFSSINLTTSNNSISLNNSSTSLPSLLQIKLNSSSNQIPSLNNNNNTNIDTNNNSNIQDTSFTNKFNNFSDNYPSLKFHNILKNN